MAERKIRVLIAKPGLDGHDRGAKVVARALRDAGFEVIYSGLRRLRTIRRGGDSEDVDAVGLSILSERTTAFFPKWPGCCGAGRSGHPGVRGRNHPERDIEGLKAAGVDAIFLPGTTTHSIVEYLRGRVPGRAA